MPAEHLARFIAEFVDEHVDLVRLRPAYTEGRGARGWKTKGTNTKGPRGERLEFVAGLFESEGVGFDFDVYRVTA